MKSLIVTADDYAMTEAIDEGIVALMDMGRLSGASCMTLSPRWPESARALTSQRQARCALGLHLDLTGFAQRPSSLKSVIVHAYTGRLDAAHLQATVARQLDLFEQALGRAPDYVDGHQHVHQLPGVRQALMAELARRYPTGPRPWLRISDAATAQGIKGHVIGALGSASLRRLARRQGLACSGRLLGVYDFQGGQAAFEQHLKHWLPHAQANAALMCHPAIRLDAQEELGPAREAEFKVLSGDGFGRLLAARQLQVADKAAALAAIQA
jgi:chitin disaccharide deacetylase